MVREESQPSIVPGKHDSLVPTFPELVNEVVLGNLVGAEVGAQVDERGQAAGGQTLQPLHRSRGWIRHKLKELGLALRGQTVHNGQTILEVLKVTSLKLFV